MPNIIETHPVLAVRSVADAVAWYEKLGFALAFADSDDLAQSRYAGIRREGTELHLQWHSPEEWAHFTQGDLPAYRFLCDDVDALYAAFKQAGVLPEGKQPRNTPWGTYELSLYDLNGNGLHFYRNL